MSGIQIIGEADAKRLMGREQALLAMEALFEDLARHKARNFPVIRESIEEHAALYGFKSGFAPTAGLLGVKAGGYWARNEGRGLDNHQSSVLLFNPETGVLQAVVSGNHLTKMRTAAACALSIKLLSRADSRTLGVIGAGKQCEGHVRAALDVRPFERVLIYNRTPDKAARVQDTLKDTGVDVIVVDAQAAVAEADVLITIVSSFTPLVQESWVKPGLHIAAMGTDTRGKQELDANIMRRAKAFADDIEQSVSIGEFQHAAASGFLEASHITPLGDVLLDPTKGRLDAEGITVFDGTGMGLQDLVAAKVCLDAL